MFAGAVFARYFMGQRSSPAGQTLTPAVGLVSQAATNFFRYHRRRSTTAMERLTFCRVTPKTGPNRNSARLTPALDRGSLLCRLMEKVEISPTVVINQPDRLRRW